MESEKIRRKLEERKSELLFSRNQNKQSAESVELDQSRVGRLSRMDSLQIQAMAVEVERRNTLELQRIEQALGRIDTDDYGYCLKCDKPISEGRLDIDPSIELCIDCASALERA